MSEKRKYHYPILDPTGPWGLRPLCRYFRPNAMYALTVSETTCEQCLINIARAQNRVDAWRKAVMGKGK